MTHADPTGRGPGARASAVALLWGLAALAVFHILLLAGVVPDGLAWGGRADREDASFVALEIAGLALLGVFALVTAARAGMLGAARSGRAARIGALIVCGYFALNVLGNLASLSRLESLIFTPVSLALAWLAWRVARMEGDRT